MSYTAPYVSVLILLCLLCGLPDIHPLCFLCPPLSICLSFDCSLPPTSSILSKPRHDALNTIECLEDVAGVHVSPYLNVWSVYVFGAEVVGPAAPYLLHLPWARPWVWRPRSWAWACRPCRPWQDAPLLAGKKRWLRLPGPKRTASRRLMCDWPWHC